MKLYLFQTTCLRSAVFNSFTHGWTHLQVQLPVQDIAQDEVILEVPFHAILHHETIDIDVDDPWWSLNIRANSDGQLALQILTQMQKPHSIWQPYLQASDGSA